jgi:hypothetical protein
MAITGISSSTFSFPFQLGCSGQGGVASGNASDSVTFSNEGTALAKARLHIEAIKIDDTENSQSEGDGFMARLHAAVTKTLDYLGERLAKAIGQLDENGNFTGKQKKALESLQAKLERSMKGSPLRRTMTILKDGAESLEAALGLGMEEIVDDTMRCFRQNLSTSFQHIRVIKPIALDIGDLINPGPISAEDAARIYDKYTDIIPLPENLPQSQPGKGWLYDESDTPSADDALRTLYNEINSGFEALLHEFLGSESAFMDTLSNSFMAQARPALFRQRGRQKPDLAATLDSGLKGMIESLQREDGLKRLDKDMDRVFGTALYNFRKAGVGILATDEDVERYDNRARELSEQLAKIKALVDAYNASQEADAATDATSGEGSGQSASSETGAASQGQLSQLDALV